MARTSQRQELADLRTELSRARFLYVRSRFYVHERASWDVMPRNAEGVIDVDGCTFEDETGEIREGWRPVVGAPCPCCGSTSAVLVSVEDDLEVLIDTHTGERWNRWQCESDDERDAFDEMKAQAADYGTPFADTWNVEIRFTCSAKGMEQLRDDFTRVCYWSGGWRSSKSHTASQWWLRGWLLHGGQNELFWLAAPEAQLAFRLMERIFWGRGSTNEQGHQRGPSIAPKYRDPESGEWQSCIASGLPPHAAVRNPHFRMVDGSVVELRHTNRVTALEGDTVRRILYDEAIRATGPEGYEILLGRVTQGSGQLGLASIPGEDGTSWWLHDKVVGPFEAGLADDKVVYRTPTYANLWLPEYEAHALELANSEDPELVQRCVYGLWSRAGGMAYVGAWDPATMAPDTLPGSTSEIGREDPTALAKLWGFEHDVTRAAGRALFGPKFDKTWLGARDFNFRPQTGLVARVFATNPRNRKTWHLVFFDEHICKGDANKAAKKYTTQFRNGLYASSGLVCDCHGFSDGHSYEGRKSETSDAYEFLVKGCMVCPPMLTPKKRVGRRLVGGLPRNPSVAESKKLVRKLMRKGRILVDGGVCIKLVEAIPKVRAGEKRERDSGSAHDRQVQNFDDCLRYLTWALFHKEAPKPIKPQSSVSW